MPVDFNVLGPFESGTNIRFVATLQAVSGSARQNITPSYQAVLVYSGSSQMISGSPTLSNTGSYFFDYSLPTNAKRADWYVEWWAVVAGTQIISRKVFTVLKTGT